MDLQQIIEQLTKQYGSGLDINKIKKKVESLADEMKGVAEKMLGGGLGNILKNVTK